MIKRINKFFFGLGKLKLIYIIILISFIAIVGAIDFIHYKNEEDVVETTETSSIGTTKTENEISIPEIPPVNNTNNTGNNSTDKNTDSTTQTSGNKTTTTPKPTTPTPTPEPEPEPEPPETLSATVAFYADNQSDTDAEDANHQRVVNNILNSGANPVFHAGDLMEDGTQDSLDRFNNVTSTLRSSRRFYAALGNNDRAVGDSSSPSPLFLNNFSFPNNERWYSVNYGNLHLVVLDSAFASGSSSQLSWLANDLQSSASQSRITGIIFHHPTFKSTIASYINNYGVDFVISGHNHSYAHSTSNGVHYFVLSGQPSIGYIKARIYTNHVEITAYNNAGGVVDTASFNER